MTETIIVAIIAFIGSLVGNYMSNNKNQALIAYRLEQLEKKVELHNKVIERTYSLEKETSLLENDLNDIKKQIDKG